MLNMQNSFKQSLILILQNHERYTILHKSKSMILFIKLTHFISKCVEFEFLRDLRFLIVSEESNIASETSPLPLPNDRTLPVFKSHLKIQIILVFAMKCKKRNREKLCPLACQRSL